MKKLLSIALCAAAAMTFAEDTSVTVANVGVTKITIPANQKNTIIASSFNALGSSSGVTISKLIRSASGLSADDILRVYSGDKYYSFKWSGSAWAASTEVSTGNTSSEVTIETATTIGQGIWFIRNSTGSDSEVTLILYGATPTSTDVTTTAGAWNLIGNPTAETVEISSGANGDRIITVENGSLREWTHNGENWGYDTTTTEEKKIGNQSMTLVKETRNKANPSIAAGIGFWYYTPSSTKITWSASE